MKSFIKGIVILIILGVLGIVFVVNPWLKRGAVERVEEATGFPAELDYLGLTVKNQGVLIRDFELKNPSGYPVEAALSVNEISAVPKVIGFVTRKPGFKSMVIDIPELNIVTRADGENNFKALAENLKTYSDQMPRSDEGKQEPSEPKTPSSPSQPIHIDRLELRLGKATLYEFSKDLTEPSRVTLELGVERTYENVEDLSDVMSDVFASVLQQNLKTIVRKEVGGLLQKMEEKNPETAQDIKDAAEAIGGQLKGLFDQLD